MTRSFLFLLSCIAVAVPCFAMPPIPPELDNGDHTITADDWPMYQGNIRHTGKAILDIPSFGSMRQCASTQMGTSTWSPPIAVDGNIYYAGAYRFVCMDVHTLNENWSVPIGEPHVSSPAYYKGRLYTVDVNSKLYAWDLDGNELWSYQSAYYNSVVYNDNSPIVVDDVIYYGTKAGWLYAVGLDGVMKWQKQLSGAIMNSVVYDRVRDRLYVGTADGHVYALGKEKGLIVWQSDIGIWLSGITMDNDILIISSQDGLYSIDASSGMNMGYFQTDGGVQSTAAVSNGKVFATAFSKKFYGLTLSDSGAFVEEWVTTTINNHPSITSCIVVNCIVIEVGCMGEITMVECEYNGQRWIDQLPSGNRGGAIVHQGKIITHGSNNGIVITYCPVYDISPTPTATVSPTPSVTPTITCSATPTDTRTASPTVTMTHSPSSTSTPSSTVSLTYTDLPTFSVTVTPTFSLTHSPTFTLTFTLTYTRTPTPTWTSTHTPPHTYTHTPTFSPTSTHTASFTHTPQPTCESQPPRLTVKVVFDPEKSDDLMLIMYSDEPIDCSKSWFEAWPHSNPRVSRKCIDIVQVDEKTCQCYLPRSEGFGDIATVVAHAEDLCGNAGISDGTFEREVIPSSWLVVTNNRINVPGCAGIHYKMPDAGNAVLEIYNQLGELVRTIVKADQPAGQYDTEWCADNDYRETVGSGVYFLVVKTDFYEEREKIVVVK